VIPCTSTRFFSSIKMAIYLHDPGSASYEKLRQASASQEKTPCYYFDESFRRICRARYSLISLCRGTGWQTFVTGF